MAKPLVKNSKPNKKLPVAQTFQVPESLLAQINECTNGSYLLVVFDANGDPQIHSHADNTLARIGLNKFCADYFGKLDSLTTDSLRAYLDQNSAAH